MDIFLDESKIFNCHLKVEGTTLSSSKCRMLIKTDSIAVIQEGTINNNGEVEVVIPRLKNIINCEKGTAILEVIADDMYFAPYTDSIVFKNRYSVEVVPENKNISIKPSMVATKINTNSTSKFNKPLQELIKTIIKKNITLENIQKNTLTITKLLERTINIYKLPPEFIEYAITSIPKYLK